MRFVFDIIYLLMLGVLSPWLLWRIVVRKKNRRGWRQKFLGMVPKRKSEAPCIWIHAVSVGEVNLLDAFIDDFLRANPGFEIAVSTTTETGFDMARQKFPEYHVFFCPTDFSWAVSNALRRIRPDVLVLTELEIWPNLVSVTSSRGIPVSLINGRISEKSFNGYRRIRWLFRKVLHKLDLAAVQTETYARRLRELGMPADRIRVCGNIKFDNAMRSQKETRALGTRLAAQYGVSDSDFLFVAGSTQEVEDRICISIFQELSGQYPQLRMVLVPRHPDRCRRLVSLLIAEGLQFTLRSETDGSSMTESAKRLIVVDTIGELGAWWSLAQAGYVGGSMGGRGGQNMIEPAFFGVPLSFGPDTWNFQDIVELLLLNNGAEVVNNQTQLSEFLIDTMTRPGWAADMGERGRGVVASQLGAASRTVALISKLQSADFAGQARENPQKAA